MSGEEYLVVSLRLTCFFLDSAFLEKGHISVETTHTHRVGLGAVSCSGSLGPTPAPLTPLMFLELHKTLAVTVTRLLRKDVDVYFTQH